MSTPLPLDWYLEWDECDGTLESNFDLLCIDLDVIVIVLFVQSLELFERLRVWDDRLIVANVVDDVIWLDGFTDVECGHISHSLLSFTVYICDIVHEFDEMTIDALIGYVATDVSCQVKDLVLTLVIVRWWLDEEVLMSFVLGIVPVVTKCWEVMIEDSVSIVLGNASQLDYTVHLFRVWQQVSFTQEVLEVLTVKLKWLLCLSWEPWILDVFLPVKVLVDNEWRNEGHDWLVEGVHDH